LKHNVVLCRNIAGPVGARLETTPMFGATFEKVSHGFSVLTPHKDTKKIVM